MDPTIDPASLEGPGSGSEEEGAEHIWLCPCCSCKDMCLDVRPCLTPVSCPLPRLDFSSAKP